MYVLLLSAPSDSSDINAMKGSSRQAGRVIGDGTTLASKRVILNHRTNNCRPDAQRKQEFRYAKWKAIISAASYHREFEDETHTSVTSILSCMFLMGARLRSQIRGNSVSTLTMNLTMRLGVCFPSLHYQLVAITELSQLICCFRMVDSQT